MITFVTATCARDFHYAKALLASIQYFHPEAGILVLADWSLPGRAYRSLSRFPNTSVLKVQDLWNRHKLYLTGLLTKLNLFFVDECKSVLFCDADSILISPILECIPSEAQFIPFSGRPINMSVEKDRRLFYDWAVTLDQSASIAPEFTSHNARYWMQSSHFFVDTTSFPRDEIIRFLPNLNLRHSPNGPFRGGDQGLLNLILNKYYVGKNGFICCGQSTISATGKQEAKESLGLRIDNGQITARPGRHFIHFVGFARRYRISRHNYGEVLKFFYNRFHSLTNTNSLLSEIDRAFSTVTRKTYSKVLRYTGRQKYLL